MDRLGFNSVATFDEDRLARQNITNNVANVSTTGFKKSFDVALKAFKADGDGFDSRFQPQAVYTNRVQMSPGPLIATGRDLDISMNHSTVLGVTAPNGELAFTRRGDLKVNTNGTLETGDGFIVRGQNGGPITVPQGFKIGIANDGAIYASDPAQPATTPPVLVANLFLKDASNTPLERRHDGLFQVENQAPGADFATGPEQVSVTSQALEGSNVNPIDAMVKMIEQSRSFEHQVQMIKEGKSNDESGATMLKLPS